MDRCDSKMDMPEVIRHRRAALGLSQAELASAAGVDKRQIRRYEAGEQQPVLSVAVAIANALRISVGELAGVPSHRINLAGDWWASWQTFKDQEEVVTSQEVRILQQADMLSIETITRGIPVDAGGYHWRGELRIWDNEVLMGWYAANDKSVRSKGTMYFVLHPHGQQMVGRWVGLSYDGSIETGWGAMSQSEAGARQLIADLKSRAENRVTSERDL